MGISVDEEDHEPVARKGHQKHDHDDGEEEEVQWWVCEEAQEDEVGDESLVSQQSHCSFQGTCHREDWDLEAGDLCSVP